MSTKKSYFKLMRNAAVISLLLIGTFFLSYKSYNHFYGSKVNADKAISTNKVTKPDTSQKKKAKEINKGTTDASITFHNVSAYGKQYTYDAKKVKDILDGKGENDGKKIAFLTFDDGPSSTVTPQILDTLKNYNVKATFCLMGQNIEGTPNSKELIQRMFQEGHAIANHTYSHNLKKLYPGNRIDVNNYIQEVDTTNNLIKGILGQDFSTRVLRLPGGYMSRKYYNDPNLTEFDAKLKEKGWYSIDWNAYDFDSEGRRKNAHQLLEHVKSSVGAQQKVVILMHDTYGKEQTAIALPSIIEYLQSQGYEFKTIS